jgi:hypothetical protein
MGIRRNKTLLEQATDYVETAVETAREKAGPILAEAKDRAGTALADARDQAAPVLTDAKDRAVPLLAAGAAVAAEKASAAADLAAAKAAEGKEAAAAKAAELNGKKRHRFRKFMIFGAVVAALGFIASKLRSAADREDWQSSYTPTPPPPARATDTPIADAAATASASAAEVADEGGAGPDEALADAAEEAHPPTTPDQPAEVVDLAADDPAKKPSARS